MNLIVNNFDSTLTPSTILLPDASSPSSKSCIKDMTLGNELCYEDGEDIMAFKIT